MLMVPSWEQHTLWTVDLQSKRQQRKGQVQRLSFGTLLTPRRSERRGETNKGSKKEISRDVDKWWYSRNQKKKCFVEQADVSNCCGSVEVDEI